MKSVKSLFTAAVAAVLSCCAYAEKSAKAVVQNGGKTLRFVYDETDYGDKGTGWYSVAEAEAQSPDSTRSWYDRASTVTNVVFDASFADYQPQHCGGWFFSFSKMTAVEGIRNLDTSAATSLRNMFSDCSSLTALGLEYFDTANVTDMAYMFADCSKLVTIMVSDKFVLNANLTGDYMFSGCTALVGGKGTAYDSANKGKAYARIDGGPSSATPGYFTGKQAKAVYGASDKTLRFVFDTKDYGTRGTDWFSVAETEAKADQYNPSWISKGGATTRVVFDPSFKDYRPKTCKRWFAQFSKLTAVDFLANLDTSTTTNMYNMFNGCSSLRTINLMGLDLSKVEDMYGMFAWCHSLTAVNFSGCDTSSVSDMGSMFYSCENQTTIYATESFVTEQINPPTSMFRGCTSLVGGEGTTYDKDHTDTEYARVDKGATKRGYFTKGEAKAVYINGEPTQLRFVYDAKDYGEKGTDWFSVEESKADMSGLLNPSWGNYRETRTRVVFDASFALYRPKMCTAWFYRHSSLKKIDGLCNLDVSSVTNMCSMFSQCSTLETLDLSHWSTANVTDMSDMFNSCTNLTTLCASSAFVTDQVSALDDMFYNCKSLVGGNGTRYVFSTLGTDKTRARIDGSAGEQGYFSEISPKAVVEDDGATLRFVYDAKDYGDKGTDWFSVAEAEVIDVEAAGAPPWCAAGANVTKVVFDASFADYRPRQCAAWFFEFSKLKVIDGLVNLNTSEASSLAYMFKSCSSLETLDLTDFDTTYVTNTMNMFFGSTSLTTIYASEKFKTDRVTASARMFYDCTALVGGNGMTYDENHVDKEYACVGDWPYVGTKGYFTMMPKVVVEEGDWSLYLRFVQDPSDYGIRDVEWFSVTEAECAAPGTLPPWHDLARRVSQVEFDGSFGSYRPKNCESWFRDFRNLATIAGLGYFNTSSVTNMADMFYGYQALETLDLTNFDTAKVTGMDRMFTACSNLVTITVSDKFVRTGDPEGVDMFLGCRSLVGGKGSTYFDIIGNDATYARPDSRWRKGYFTLAAQVAENPLFTVNGEGVGAESSYGDGWSWDGQTVRLTIGGGSSFVVTGGTIGSPVNVAFQAEAGNVELVLSNFCSKVTSGSVLSLTNEYLKLTSAWGNNRLEASGSAPVINVPADAWLEIATTRLGSISAQNTGGGACEVSIGTVGASSCGTIEITGDGLLVTSHDVGLEYGQELAGGKLIVRNGLNALTGVRIPTVEMYDGTLAGDGVVTSDNGFTLSGGSFGSNCSKVVSPEGVTLKEVTIPVGSETNETASGVTAYEPVRVSGLPSDYGQDHLRSFGPHSSLSVWLPLRDEDYVITANDTAYVYTYSDMASGKDTPASIREKGSATGVKVNGTAVAYGGAGTGWQMVDDTIQLDGTEESYELTTEGAEISGVGVKALAPTAITLNDFRVRQYEHSGLDLGDAGTNLVTLVGTNVVTALDAPAVHLASNATMVVTAESTGILEADTDDTKVSVIGDVGDEYDGVVVLLGGLLDTYGTGANRRTFIQKYDKVDHMVIAGGNWRPAENDGMAVDFDGNKLSVCIMSVTGTEPITVTTDGGETMTLLKARNDKIYVWLPNAAPHAFSVNGGMCYLAKVCSSGHSRAKVELGEPGAARGFTVDDAEVGEQLFGPGWCANVAVEKWTCIYLISDDPHVVTGGTPDAPVGATIVMDPVYGDNLVLSNFYAYSHDDCAITYVGGSSESRGLVRVRGEGAKLESGGRAAVNVENEGEFVIDVDRHAVFETVAPEGKRDIWRENQNPLYHYIGDDADLIFSGEGVVRLSQGLGAMRPEVYGSVIIQNGYVYAPQIGGDDPESSIGAGWGGYLRVSGGTLVTDYVRAQTDITGGSIICTNYRWQPKIASGDIPVYRVTAGGLTAEYEQGHDGELAYQNPIQVSGLGDYGVESIFPVDGEVCFLLPDGTYDFWVGQRHYTATVNGADVEAAADDASPWTYVKEGDYVTITGCINPAQDLVVPAELGGGQVWKLADNLFADCTNIRTVALPDTVEHIGDAVFCGCSNVVSITGIGNVKSFGVSAFEGCASLTTLAIPYVYEIPDQCFFGCSSLTNITIPSWCKRIGMAAFASCAFDELTVPEGVTNIGHYAFLNGRINSIRLPSTVASIGTGAFADVTGLTNVFINAMQAPATGANPFAGVSDTATLQVPTGSCGWDGDPASSALPERWNGLLVVAYVPAYNTPEGAVAIGGAEGAESVINNGATADPADPVAEFSEDDLASSVWFRWTAPSTGLVTFRTETLVENHDTVMSISRGTPGDFTTVAYNDDADGETLMSKATFACTAGTDYYICVATKDAGSPWGEVGIVWEIGDAAPVAATGAFVNGVSVGDNLGGDGWIFTDGLVHIQLNRDFAITGGTAETYANVGIRVETDAHLTFTDTYLYAGEKSAVMVRPGCVLDMDVRGTRCVFARTTENNDSQIIEAVYGATLNLNVSRHTELVTEGLGVAIGGKDEGCGDIAISGDGILTLNERLGIAHPNVGYGRIDINGCQITAVDVSCGSGSAEAHGSVFLNCGTLTIGDGSEEFAVTEAYPLYVNGGHLVNSTASFAVYTWDGSDAAKLQTAQIALSNLVVRYETGHESERAYQLPIAFKGMPETYGTNSLYTTSEGVLTLHFPQGTYALTNDCKRYFFTVGDHGNASHVEITDVEPEPEPEPKEEATNVDFAHALELTVTGYDSTNQILKASGKLWYHLTAGLRGTIDFWASADDSREMKLTVYKGTNESELVEVPRGTEFGYWAQIKVDVGDAYYAVVESDEPGEEVGISFAWNYTEPTGFENWAYENGLTGDDAAMDAKSAKWGGQWANAFIYAFGEDIVSGKNPLMQISFDAELKPVITLAPQINGIGEIAIEVRGLVDLGDDWESDFIMLEQTGARTWEVPAAKEEEEEPAPEPHFFRVVIF